MFSQIFKTLRFHKKTRITPICNTLKATLPSSIEEMLAHMHVYTCLKNVAILPHDIHLNDVCGNYKNVVIKGVGFI